MSLVKSLEELASPLLNLLVVATISLYISVVNFVSFLGLRKGIKIKLYHAIFC